MAGAGAASGPHDFSGQRWWGWSPCSRGFRAHDRGDEHFLLEAKPQLGSRALASPQPSLRTEGSRARAWGPEHTADALSARRPGAFPGAALAKHASL